MTTELDLTAAPDPTGIITKTCGQLHGTEHACRPV